MLSKTYTQTLKQTLKKLAVSVSLGLVALPLLAADVRIGIVSNSTVSDSIYVAAELAKKEGLNVRIVEFSDWVLPNTAVVNGDIDLNYFQHVPFLNNAEKARGFKLEPIAYGVEGLVGLYSKRYTSFDQVKRRDRIAIADDPVNQGRGLQLLEQAGLIKLREGKGHNATLHDVVENRLGLRFTELPGPQLARAIDDVAIIQSFPHYIKAAGVKDPADALIFTQDHTHTFALRFVAHQDKANDPAIKRFIQIYHTAPEVRESLFKAYGNKALYTLAWETDSHIGAR